MSGVKQRKNAKTKAEAPTVLNDTSGKGAAGAPGGAPPVGKPGELSHGMKMLLVAVSILMIPLGAASTTLGIQYVIQRGDGLYDEQDDRITFPFAYALFEATVILLAAVSVAWLFIYGVVDMYAGAHGRRASNVPFAVAMKRIIPTLLGGMWLGHAIRLGLNLQNFDRQYLREWALTILATNGPAILLYTRVRSKATAALAAAS